MREKRFAFVLAAALCAVSVGALAGCSGGTGGNSGETPGGTAETKEYTVKFDSAGGTAVQSVTVQEGATLKAPEAPVKATFSARYAFTGWYYEGRLWVFDADVVDGDITLTANWELAEEYTNVYPPKS